MVYYYARENDDVGEAVGEVRITIGELKNIDKESFEKQEEVGIRVDLTSFFPTRIEPIVYGTQSPCISLLVKKHSNGTISIGDWEAKAKSTTISLILEGTGITESPRVRAGLTDFAAESLEEGTKKYNAKSYGNACGRKEERRWKYVKNWKEYPKTITISGEEFLNGIYQLAHCEQTTNMSSIWMRESISGQPRLYVLIQPNIHRIGPDRAVITTSINHDDSTAVVASLPAYWQPNDALLSGKHQVKGIRRHHWESITNFACRASLSNIKILSPLPKSDNSVEDLFLSIMGLSEDNMDMLCNRVTTDEKQFELPLVGGQKAQQIVRAFNAICSTPILKHAAKGDLNFSLDPCAPWIQLKTPKQGLAPFGCCDISVPPKPSELWVYDEERKRWDRKYESKKSREYHLALINAPKPFKFVINKDNSSLDINFSSYVTAHQVAKQLMEGREISSTEVAVSFRFSDTALQTDPIITPFKVKACDYEAPTDVPLKEPFKLYLRQQKVVTKMIEIERANSSFEELEMTEHGLPGSTGISMTCRATRKAKLRGGVIADAIGAGKTVISIAIILKGLEEAASLRKAPQLSSATLVVMPPALLRQWENEIKKFAPKDMKVRVIYDFNSLKRLSAKDIVSADVVIVPIDILESTGYFENVMKLAKMDKMKPYPKIPTYSGQKELNGARGVWIPASSADPYGGSNNSSNQSNRNQSAYYTHLYQEAIKKLRGELRGLIKGSSKGVPLEFFEWERIIVDEVHESLCTTKSEIDDAREKDKDNFFKEKNRRAGREFLGICIKNPRSRPLRCRKGVFGLTGTPLLDSSDRVVELANLMGNTYIVGLSSHWRKLEKESSRDIFLESYLEPKQGREVRKAVFDSSQAYLDVACCRNKTGEEMNGIELITHTCTTNMTEDEKDVYCRSQKGIPSNQQSLSITPEDFEDASILPFLKQNAELESRGKKLVEICKNIQKEEKKTKIIVFTDGSCFAGEAACAFLRADEDIGGCTSLSPQDNNETKNEKISWYQNADATKEDRNRPRILVLHFEHCAGLNLQSECNNLILFSPLYTGAGGTSSDVVADVSTEQQAIGRVYRAGQKKNKVNVYKLVVKGPNGEETLDGQILRRNTNKDTIAMATNAAD